MIKYTDAIHSLIFNGFKPVALAISLEQKTGQRSFGSVLQQGRKIKGFKLKLEKLMGRIVKSMYRIFIMRFADIDFCCFCTGKLVGARKEYFSLFDA